MEVHYWGQVHLPRQQVDTPVQESACVAPKMLPVGSEEWITAATVELGQLDL